MGAKLDDSCVKLAKSSKFRLESRMSVWNPNELKSKGEVFRGSLATAASVWSTAVVNPPPKVGTGKVACGLPRRWLKSEA